MLLFGRSPLVWLAALQSVLAFLLTLPAVGLTQPVAAAIMVVASGLFAGWEAVVTRPFVITALTGAVRTILVAIAGFGIVLPEATLTAFVSGLAVVLALILQPNTTPTGDPAPGFLRTPSSGGRFQTPD